MASDQGTDDTTGTCTPQSEPEVSDGLKTFGAVLKALRTEAGLTQEEFAARVRYSTAYVAKFEQGKRFPPVDLPARAGEALGRAAGRILEAAAESLRRRVGLASWFRQWAGIEEEAITLYAYECRAVPGLLQPESYVRAIFERRLPSVLPEQLEREVAARLERHQLILEKPGTIFSFIIEEAVLSRCLGGPVVTREVIDHLLSVGQRPNVDIQVMPLRHEEHAGANGQLYLAESAEHQWFGYTEGHRSSALITAHGDVSVLQLRYGKLRSQARDWRATVKTLEQMRGAL